MVKRPTKPQSITNISKTSPNPTPKLDSKLSKTRQQINQANYQKNKDQRKEKRRVRYQQQKEQEQLTTKQIQDKYYQAEAIKILMTFKEYTELNKEKRKLWTDFNWTLKNCASDIKEGFGSIVSIMKLEQVANNLIRDYWDTAKTEERKLSKSWNSLDYDEQQKLIRYWGYERARIENGYLTTAEELEKQSQEYLKDIERAKFHEERGKIKCPCYDCEAKKEIQAEIKAKLNKEMDGYDQRNKASDKEQCPECKRMVKELDEESGVCKSCKRKYE